MGRTASEPVRRLSSGLEAIDALLRGGVPQGRISELLGPLSSGKTSFLLALFTAATRRGEVVACVDLADALHPESVAVAGTDLQRLLWVRPCSLTDGFRCTELLLQAGGFALVVLDLGTCRPRPQRSHVWPRHVWPRLLRAAEQSHTALLVLAPQRVAGSFAVLSLSMQPRGPLWQRGAWPLFAGFHPALVMARNKLGIPEAKSVKLRVQSQSSDFPAFRLSAFSAQR